MPTPPVLETARLVLKTMELADFDAYLAVWQDPAVARYITGEPPSREVAWTAFLRKAGLWCILGFGAFVVREKATGDYVGDVGLMDMQRGLTPSLDGTLEVGWVLAPRHHGKGYAQEAVSAAMAWGAQAFPDRPFSCIIDPGNAPSLALAARLGFVRGATVPYHGHEVVIHRG